MDFPFFTFNGSSGDMFFFPIPPRIRLEAPEDQSESGQGAKEYAKHRVQQVVKSRWDFWTCKKVNRKGDDLLFWLNCVR